MPIAGTEVVGGAVAPTHCWTGLEDLWEPLRRLLSSRCRDENEVEDVIQETLLRAARYRGSLSDPGRLRSWAGRIALNVLRDRAARTARGPSVGLDDEVSDFMEGRESFPGDAREEPWFEVEGEVLDRDGALDHLAAGWSELKPHDQSVLDTYYRGGERCSSTAKHFGISAHLAKVHLFRARRRLETLMRQRVATRRLERLLGRAHDR